MYSSPVEMSSITASSVEDVSVHYPSNLCGYEKSLASAERYRQAGRQASRHADRQVLLYDWTNYV